MLQCSLLGNKIYKKEKTPSAERETKAELNINKFKKFPGEIKDIKSYTPKKEEI